MALPRSRAPFWFQLCVAAALALLVRLVCHDAGAGGAAVGRAPLPAYAFLGFLIAIAELIWKGLEVAGKITLEILHWMVVNLSLVVTKIKNGLGALGGDLLKGLKRGWDFTRKLYDDVLKPAWRKFWSWFDKFRKWLDRTFGPLLAYLKKLRDSFLLFYKTWIQPWLDLIDVTRKGLRVLASMGLDWARALDQRLGDIESAIEKPFRVVLAKLNEVINVVNRVVTLDGLLQRVALIRSLARDYQYAWQAIANPWQAAFDHNSTPPIDAAIVPRTAAQISSDYGAWVKGGGGPRAAMYAAIEAAVRKEYQRD